MRALFADRRHAGRALAALLETHANQRGAVVLGLPRGGVVVAYEVAAALDLPLDVFVVRKLGVPGHEELAFGALAAGGFLVLDQDTVRQLAIDQATIDRVIAGERAELDRRERLYRAGRPPLDVQDKTVLLIDDGLATGSTVRAAVAALRAQLPARIVVGAPVGAPPTCADLRSEADDVVCAATPEPFFGVGMWYENFAQTTDQEVEHLLGLASQGRPDRPLPLGNGPAPRAEGHGPATLNKRSHL